MPNEANAVPLLQLLACVSDHSVRVWDANTGALRQRMEGHGHATCGALDCHPTEPRLAMSAGYDGLTIVWDLATGAALAKCAALTLAFLPCAECMALLLPTDFCSWLQYDKHFANQKSSLGYADLVYKTGAKAASNDVPAAIAA